MKILFLLFFLGYSLLSHSQRAKEFMIAGHADLIKTDNRGPFKKTQIATEMNYFLTDKFSVLAGNEIRFSDRQRPRLPYLIGFRYYPISSVFFRPRWLIGYRDLSAGLGWSKAFGKKWKFETAGDYYFYDNEFSLKAGVAFTFNPKSI